MLVLSRSSDRSRSSIGENITALFDPRPVVFRALSPWIRSFLQIQTAKPEIHGRGQRHSINEYEDNVGQHLSEEDNYKENYSDVAFVEQVLLVYQGMCGTGMIWELERPTSPRLPRRHLSKKNCVDWPDGCWTLSSHLIENIGLLILRWIVALIDSFNPDHTRKTERLSVEFHVFG